MSYQAWAVAWPGQKLLCHGNLAFGGTQLVTGCWWVRWWLVIDGGCWVMARGQWLDDLPRARGSANYWPSPVAIINQYIIKPSLNTIIKQSLNHQSSIIEFGRVNADWIRRHCAWWSWWSIMADDGKGPWVYWIIGWLMVFDKRHQHQNVSKCMLTRFWDIDRKSVV